MALVVEDGTGVANANSYVDLVYLTAYAAERGYDIPATDADKEKFAIIAMDLLESMGDLFKGTKTDKDQSLQWPRDGAYIDETEFSSTSIPEALKKAQCQLVVVQQQGHNLYPDPVTNTQQGIVVEEKIGPLTTRYSGLGSGRNVLASRFTPIVFASVNVFLKPLFKSGTSMPVTRA